jgi:hypothetical protein
MKLPQATAAISLIMSIIETSESGKIDKKILHEAIKQVAFNNNVTLSLDLVNSFVSEVFEKADFEQSGSISRNALEMAMVS